MRYSIFRLNWLTSNGKNCNEKIFWLRNTINCWPGKQNYFRIKFVALNPCIRLRVRFHRHFHTFIQKVLFFRFKISVKQYESERHELNEKYESTKTELLLLKGRFSVLTQVNNQFKNQSDKRNDANFYSMITEELKEYVSI